MTNPIINLIKGIPNKLQDLPNKTFMFTKITISVIIIVLSFYIVKKILAFRKKYPRPISFGTKLFGSNIRLSGKYNRTTGLDEEIGTILSKSIADYLIIFNIDSNIDSNIENKKSLIDDYIKDKNKDYKLYNELACFYKESENLFNEGDQENNKITYKQTFEENEHFKGYLKLLTKTGDNQYNLNKYLYNFYKTKSCSNEEIQSKQCTNKEVNKCLLNNDGSKVFYKDLQKKITNTEYYNLDFGDSNNFNDNKQKIVDKFKEILIGDLVEENTLQEKKIIFLRNILYKILQENSEALDNQLEKLDNKNVLSYINPNSLDDINELLKDYELGNLNELSDLNNLDETRIFEIIKSDIIRNNELFDRIKITLKNLDKTKSKSFKIKISKDITIFDENDDKNTPEEIILICIDKLNKFRESCIDQNITYDEAIKHYYYIEKLTTMKYYDLKKVESRSFIENKEDKNSLIKLFKGILNHLLVIRDLELINTSFILHKNIENDKENKFLQLIKFYYSFFELKLAQNYVHDVTEYKENRDGINLKQFYHDYFLKKIMGPKFKYIWYTSWNFGRMRRVTQTWFQSLEKLLGNECVWFNTRKERKFLGIRCEGFIEHFGFLKGLLKIPKMFAKAPEFFQKFIQLCVMFIRLLVVLNPVGIIISIINLGFIGFLTIAIKLIIFFIILFLLVIFKLPVIVGISAGIGLTPIGIGIAIYSVIMFILSILLTKDMELMSLSDSFSFLIYAIILFVIALFISFSLIVIILVVSIFTLIVWIIDQLANNWASKILYNTLLSCENDPLNWYKESRYDLGNKKTKGIFCYKTCRTNYKLSSDKMFCERSSNNVPYYCPQPLLYRVFKDEYTNGSYSLKPFIVKDNPQLLFMNQFQQNAFILNYKNNKKNYYNSCSNVNSGDYKNTIGKSVCAANHNEKDINIKNKINNICRDTYCTNGNYENFCYKYPEKTNNLQLDFIKDKNKRKMFTKNALLLVILTIIITFIMYNMEKNKKISIEYIKFLIKKNNVNN